MQLKLISDCKFNIFLKIDKLQFANFYRLKAFDVVSSRFKTFCREEDHALIEVLHFLAFHFSIEVEEISSFSVVDFIP